MSIFYEGPDHPKDGRYSRRIAVTLECPEVSPFTDQSYADECDINVMMARYQATGEVPVVNQVAPQFLDVTEQDFQRHMDIVLEAEDLFGQLPSAIRDRFGNDPGAFLGFVSDDANYAEAVKLGLLSEEATKRFNTPPTPQPPIQEPQS